MKKFLFLALLLALGSFAHAVDFTPVPTPTMLPTEVAEQPPFLSLPNGGDVFTNQHVGLGRAASGEGTLTIPCTNVFNGTITKGQVVVLAGVTYSASVYGYYTPVSLAASLADVNRLGIAYDSAAFGQRLRVAVKGKIHAPTAGIVVTSGQLLSVTGTSSALTGSSAVTSANFTSVSRSPIAAIALESTTYTAKSPLVYILP